MGDLELIWRPLRIGATTVRHRIMVAPHGQAYGENHQPSDRMVAYFAERARGGAALVGVEATSASRHLSGAQAGWCDLRLAAHRLGAAHDPRLRPPGRRGARTRLPDLRATQHGRGE